MTVSNTLCFPASKHISICLFMFRLVKGMAMKEMIIVQFNNLLTCIYKNNFKMKKLIAVFISFIISFIPLLSQTFIQPNIGLKSHETLELRKLEISAEKTVVTLQIENKIEGGNFCADRNVFIVYPDGSKSKLVNAVGIPQCPDTYKFKSIGEKLGFTLTFPPLKPGTAWIDIVEECSANCFYFYGITLDNDLNKRLDEAFIIAAKGDPEKNMLLFRNILESVDKQNLGIEGLLYINIITAAVEAGDKVETSVWYKRLLSSHTPRLKEYVKYLNDRGIK
jgi:hypothetical protein